MAKKFFPISIDAMAVLKPASTGSGGSLGAGKDWHINVGRTGNYVARGLMKFNIDFTGMTSITSATLYVKTAASTLGTLNGYNRDTHTVPNAGTMKIYRITKTWSEGTYGNDEIWYGANSVEWSTFATGSTDASVNTLTGVDTGSVITTANTTTSRSVITSYDITNHIRAWAPTDVPVNGVNGSAATNYGILLKMPTEAVDGGNLDSIEFYSREAYAYSTTYGAGTGGNTTASEWVGGVAGASAYIEVVYTSIGNPTGTPTDPASGGLAQIINLEDTAEWTSAGQHARPRLEWSYTSGGGGAQTYWWVSIYSDASKTTTYYDTGWVNDAAHRSDLYFDIPADGQEPAWLTSAGYYMGWNYITGLVNGQTYYWTIQVADELGNQSAESSPTAFKVRWGQAIHNWDSGASGTGGWSISHSAIPANTQISKLYRAVTTTTTNTGAWTDDIASITGTTRYLQTLTRMSTDVSGTKPYITDMTFSYNNSAVPPDNWLYDSSTLILDTNERRFGTKSALWKATGTGAAYVQPLRNTNEYDLKVLHNTKYTFSAYIKPKKADGTSSISTRDVKLRVYKSTGLSAAITGLTEIATSDNYSLFEADNENWYRLTVTFTTDGSTDYVKPVIYLYGTGAVGDYLYIDGVQFEEGTVVRSWTPGFVTQSVTVEGGGISVDASKGGALRLRGSTAGLRDIVEVGANGLDFGGSSVASLYSGSASTLNVTGDLSVTGAIKTATNNLDPAVYIGDDALIFDTDTADAMGIQGQQTAANGVLIFGSGKDTNLYRGGANILKTDDNLWAAGYIKSGMTAQRYSNAGTVTDTTGVGTGYSDIPSHTITFTPDYVGQRWMISWVGSCVTNTATVQYVIYQVFVDGGNLFYTRASNLGSGINYSANVSGSDVYTSVGTSAVVCKVGVRMQTTTGVTVSTYYGRLSATPVP